MGCLVRMTRLLYLGLMMPNTMPGGIRHPRPRLLVLLPAVKDLVPTSQRQAKLVGCVNAGIAGGEHHVNLRRVGRSNVNTRSSKPSTASGSTAVAQALDPTVAPRVQCPCLYGPRQPPLRPCVLLPKAAALQLPQPHLCVTTHTPRTWRALTKRAVGRKADGSACKECYI